MTVTRRRRRAAAPAARPPRHPTRPPSAERDALFRRGAVPDPAVREAARGILADVRARGAVAVRDAAARFGGGSPRRPAAPRPGPSSPRPPTRSRPRSARRSRRRSPTSAGSPRRSGPPRRAPTIVPGVELERRWLPVSRVGAYVPGGSAPYPSSLVMTRGPGAGRGRRGDRRRVARGPRRRRRPRPARRGRPARRRRAARRGRRPGDRRPRLRAAGRGPARRPTSSSAPGSAWVTAAKVELAGEVAIDLPAGPSEGLVLADASADPSTVAADLITQAEHGVDSPALLVTPDEAFADAVEAEVRRRLATALRRDILARALADHGRIVLVADLDAGIAFVNGYGPEHLSIDVADARGRGRPDPQRGLDLRRAAGRPESAGDYASGAEPRPADGRPRARLRAARGRDLRQVHPGPADHARGPGDAPARPSAPSPRPRACSPTATPSRPASTTPPRPTSPPDEPEPVRRHRRPPTPPRTAGRRPTRASPSASASRSRRSCGSTSTPRPRRPRSLAGPPRRGPVRDARSPSTRRATTASLVEAAADAYGVATDELVPGAGADEILDMCTKAFLPAGEAAVVSVPTYPMYRIHAEQRGGRVIAVPRLGRRRRLGDGRRRRSARRPARRRSSGSATRTTRPAGRSPRARSSACSTGIEADAAADGRPAPAVVVDEAYSEFTGGP